MRAVLIAGGWLYAAAIVILSLMPAPPDPGFAYGDKLGHFFAYSLLMFWFCALYQTRHLRVAYGCGWIAMGIGIEFAQSATGYRAFELADMAANALGVLAGAASAALTLPRAAAARETGTP
jgi:VanZ family protein